MANWKQLNIHKFNWLVKIKIICHTEVWHTKFKPGLPHRTGYKITTSTTLSPSTQKWYTPLNSKIPTHYISPTVIFPNYIQLIFQNGIFIIHFQLIQHFHITTKIILLKKACLNSSFRGNIPCMVRKSKTSPDPGRVFSSFSTC